jgi:hypothetical protein
MPPPSVSAVRCKQRCAGEGMARKGSRVVVKGTQLGDVVRVTFSGSASAAPRSVSDTRVTVRVPRGAITGPLVLTDSAGQLSAPSPDLQILQPAGLRLGDGPFATSVVGRRAFIDGARRPTLAYRLQGDASETVTVSVVSQASRAVVKTYDEGLVDPGALRAVAWDGTTDAATARGASARGARGTRTRGRTSSPSAARRWSRRAAAW